MAAAAAVEAATSSTGESTTPHFAAAAAGAGGAHPSLMGRSSQQLRTAGVGFSPVARNDMTSLGVEANSSRIVDETGIGAHGEGLPAHGGALVTPPTENAILETISGVRAGSLRGLLIPTDDESNAGSQEEDEEPEECCAVHGKHLGICGWNWHHWTVFWARSIGYNPWFEGFIVLCIVLSGALVGVQLYPVAKEPAVAEVLDVMDACVVTIFTVEVLIKLVAEGASIIEFFRSPSNNLDFFIVVISFVPFEDNDDAVGTATLIRTIRLLRLLKLVKTVPQLRVLVMGVAESVSSIGYIFALLMLLIFIYGVAGNSWFAENDPFNFGTLDQSMVTVFRAVTLEDISDLLYRAVVGCDQYPMPARQELCVNPQPQPVLGSAFMLSITVLGNLVLLNLTVAVVVMAHGRATDQIRAEQALEAEERRAKVRELVAQREMARAKRARSKQDKSPSNTLGGANGSGGPGGGRLQRVGLAVAGAARWASGAGKLSGMGSTTDSVRSKTSIAALITPKASNLTTSTLAKSAASIAHSKSGQASSSPMAAGTPTAPNQENSGSPRSPRRPALESMMRARGALMATRAYLPGSRSEGRGGGGLASIALAAGAQGRAITSVAASESRTGPQSSSTPGASASSAGIGGSGFLVNESSPARNGRGSSTFSSSPSHKPHANGGSTTSPITSPGAATRLLRAAALARQHADVTNGIMPAAPVSPGDAPPPLLLHQMPTRAAHATGSSEPIIPSQQAGTPSPDRPPSTRDADSGPSTPLLLGGEGRERSRTATIDAMLKAQEGVDTRFTEAEASRRLARIAGLVADAAEVLEQLAPAQVDLDASTLILHAVVDGQLRPPGVRGWVMAAGEACPTVARRVARCCNWQKLEEASQEIAPPSARRRRSVVFLDDDLDLEDDGWCCCDVQERLADILDWFPCHEVKVRRTNGLTDSFWSPARGAVSAIAAMSAARTASLSNPASSPPGHAAVVAFGGAKGADSMTGGTAVKGRHGGRYATRVVPTGTDTAIELADGGSVIGGGHASGATTTSTKRDAKPVDAVDTLPEMIDDTGAAHVATTSSSAQRKSALGTAPAPPPRTVGARSHMTSAKLAWSSQRASPTPPTITTGAAASTAPAAAEQQVVPASPTVTSGSAIGTNAARVPRLMPTASPLVASKSAWGRLKQRPSPAAARGGKDQRRRPTVDRRAMAVIRVLQAVSALEGDRSTVMDLAAKNAAKMQLARARGEDVKSPSHAAALQSSLHAAIEQDKMQQQKGVLGARKPFASFISRKAPTAASSAQYRQAKRPIDVIAASIQEFEESLESPVNGSRDSTGAASGVEGGTISATSAMEPAVASSSMKRDDVADTAVLSPPGAAAARPMAFASADSGSSPGHNAPAIGFGSADGVASGSPDAVGRAVPSGVISATSPMQGASIGAAAGDTVMGGFFFSNQHAGPAGTDLFRQSFGVGSARLGETDSKPVPGTDRSEVSDLERPVSRAGMHSGKGVTGGDVVPGLASKPSIATLGGSFRRPKSKRALDLANQMEEHVAHAALTLVQSRRFISVQASTGANSARSHMPADLADSSDSEASRARLPAAKSPRQGLVFGIFGSKRQMTTQPAATRSKAVMSRRALVLPRSSRPDGASNTSRTASKRAVSAMRATPRTDKRAQRPARSPSAGPTTSAASGGIASRSARGGQKRSELDSAIGAQRVSSSHSAISSSEDEDDAHDVDGAPGAMPSFGRGSTRRGQPSGSNEDGIAGSISDSVSLDVEATRFRRINTAAKVLAAVGPRAAAAQRRARARVIGKGGQTSADAEASAVADTLQQVARLVAEDEAHVAVRATQSFQYKIASAAGATVALAAARKGIASFRRAQNRAKTRSPSQRHLSNATTAFSQYDHEGGDGDDEDSDGQGDASALQMAEEEWGSDDEDDAEEEAKSLLVEAWPEEHRARVLRGVRIVATMLLSHKNRQARKWRQRWRRYASEGEQQLALYDSGILDAKELPTLKRQEQDAVDDVEAEFAKSKRRLF